MVDEKMGQMKDKLLDLLSKMKQKEYEDMIKIKSLEEINKKLIIENRELKKKK